MNIEQLNAAIECAINTEMYREKLAGKRSVTSEEEFQLLPLTTKEDLRASYPYKNLGVSKQEIIEMHATSGTSGQPTASFFTREDLDKTSEYVAKAWHNFGVNEHSVVQFMMSYGLFSGAALNSYAIQSLGGLIIPAGIQSVEKQMDMIKNFHVDTVAATPSYYLCIYNRLTELGIDPKSLGLKVGIAAGEAYSDELKAKIADLFGIRLYDHYGLCEVNTGIIYECSSCGRMAVIKDYIYAEVIDPVTGDVLPEGQYGELVLTSTMKKASPVLRYRTGDVAAVLGRSSSCQMCHGSTIVSRIKHRIDDAVFYKGLLISPHEVRDLIVLNSDTAVDNVKIQAIKNADDIIEKIRVKIALVAPGSNPEFIAGIEQKLRVITSVSMQVEQVPKSYFNQKSLKVKLVEYVSK